jgi:hypothetical protein
MTSLVLDSASIAPTVERAIAGDEIAFARIVAAYHLDLVRVPYVCGDEDLAENRCVVGLGRGVVVNQCGVVAFDLVGRKWTVLLEPSGRQAAPSTN